LLKFFSNLLAVLVFLVILGAGGAIIVFYYYGRGLPDYKHLAQYEPPVVTRLYANDGRLFAEYASEKRVFVPIEAIPKRIIQTFLAAEDKNFYEHYGLDFGGIVRTAYTNIKRAKQNRRPAGASTITQQVAKNFLLHDISNEVSFSRKIKEAILAFRLEHAYTKDHILELYLNEIYLGAGSYGVAAAALNYFNKSLGELTIAEAAFLAGLPKAPSHYHPITAPVRAKIRRDWVIGRMLEEGIITQEDAKKAIQQPIVLHSRDPAHVVQASYFAEEVRRDLFAQFGEHALYEGGLTIRTSVDPRLQSIAQQTLCEGLVAYDRRHGWRGPVTRILIASSEVNSKANLPLWVQRLEAVPRPAGIGKWQLAVVLKLDKEKAHIGFENGSNAKIPLTELKWARRYIHSDQRGAEIHHPKDVLTCGDVVMVESLGDKMNNYKLCQIPSVSGGIVAIDPHTGRVLAMSGGYSFEISQYNRATQAYRQCGSAFKPFVYLAGLEKGLTPSTVILDAPIAINMGYGLGVWKPGNYDKKYLGPITLRSALEKSRNAVTVRMAHEMIGIKPIIDITKRFGIIENLPRQMAMVLGAGETTLLKLTAGYAMIANGGKKITPTFIDRVADRHGKTIWKREAPSCSGCSLEPWLNQPMPTLTDNRLQVTDPETAYQMVSLLEGAVTRGTGRIVKTKVPNQPLAGKTGTTNNFFDTWFVGFSPDLVVGVYVGFDSPRTLGDKEAGARVAAPMFGDFMTEALKNTPAIPFRIPPGIRLMRVNHESGLIATPGDSKAIFDAFKVGHEPPTQSSQEASEFPDEQTFEEQSLDASKLDMTLPNNQRPQPQAPSTDAMTGTGGIY